MSNQDIQLDKTQETNSDKKEGIFVKISKGMSWWLGRLTGRSKGQNKTTLNPQGSQQAVPGNQPSGNTPAQQEELPEEEDSVAEDIKKFKSFFMRSKKNIESKVTPTTSKMAAKTSQAVSETTNRVGFLSILKIITLIVIIVALVLLAIKALGYVNKGNGNGGDGNRDSTPTPTPVSYRPYVPSIYAEDKEILKLEEDINVLSREFSTTVFRETRLNPPQLDFNISF